MGMQSQFMKLCCHSCTSVSLDMKKMVGMGSDGASVMVGIRNGVIALLKRAYPQVKSIHCMAHRLALAAAQAAKDLPYMAKFKSTLTQLCYYYQNSPVRTAGLKAIEDVLNAPKLKCIKASDVHWLSHDTAIKNLRQTLPAVLASLGRESEERHDPTARGLLMFARKFKFCAALMMFRDLLQKLTYLSKMFQTSSVYLTMVASKVQATANAIRSLKGGTGEYMLGLETYIQGGH